MVTAIKKSVFDLKENSHFHDDFFCIFDEKETNWIAELQQNVSELT